MVWSKLFISFLRLESVRVSLKQDWEIYVHFAKHDRELHSALLVLLKLLLVIQLILGSRRSGLVRYTQHTLPVILLALLSSFSFRHRQDAYAFCAMLLRAFTVALYKASLKANKKAAVMTLWVTLGPMPKGESLVSIRHVRKHILNLPP